MIGVEEERLWKTYQSFGYLHQRQCTLTSPHSDDMLQDLDRQSVKVRSVHLNDWDSSLFSMLKSGVRIEEDSVIRNKELSGSIEAKGRK